MANLTPEEKRLLLTAKRIRQIVKADVEKTANPAIMALVRAIGPALSRLGPKLVEMIKAIPPDAWGQIAQNIASVLAQAAQAAGTKSAASEFTKTKTLHTIAGVEKSLRRAGIKGSKQLAEQLVLASMQAVAEHRKTPNKKLVDAVKMVNDAKAEIALLREFV
jgi:hypothetical protein